MLFLFALCSEGSEGLCGALFGVPGLTTWGLGRGLSEWDGGETGEPQYWDLETRLAESQIRPPEGFPLPPPPLPLSPLPWLPLDPVGVSTNPVFSLARAQRPD